jgi:hypothetical protein
MPRRGAVVRGLRLRVSLRGLLGARDGGGQGHFFAAVPLRRGSLVAPMVMHFLQDFIAIVAVALLAGK